MKIIENFKIFWIFENFSNVVFVNYSNKKIKKKTWRGKDTDENVWKLSENLRNFACILLIKEKNFEDFEKIYVTNLTKLL